MSRDSDRSRIARALLAGTFALALGSSMGTAAQAPAPEAAAGATSVAAPADQPTSRRDRRGNAEPAAEQPAAAQAVVAAQPIAAATVAEPRAETVEARMVCKNIKQIGTKISRRVCGTPEQWAATNKRTSDDASETMRHVRQQSGVMTTQSGTPGPGGFGAN